MDPLSPVAEKSSGPEDAVFNRIMRKIQHATAIESNRPQPNQTKPQHPSSRSGSPAPQKAGAATGAGGDESNRGVAQVLLAKDDSTASKGLTASGRKLVHRTLQEDEDEDEEKKTGSIPAPPTLRLMIQNVHRAVKQRLEFAEFSSLQEAMKSIYESRALLDKLLKDIPQHKNFEEVVGTGTSIQEMFQGFRKNPVLLPSSGYQKDPHSFRMVPEIRERQAFRNSPPNNPTPTNEEGVEESGSGTLAPVQTGRKASTLMPHQPSATALGGRRQAAGVRSRRESRATSPRPRRISDPPTQGAQKGAPQSWKDQQMLLRHLRRQTQLMSTETQTTETISHYVHESKYKEVQHKNEQFSQLIQEYEVLVEKLQTQLDAAKGAMANRTKVVNYLRGTMFKECCQLRNQISVLSTKSQQQNSMINQFNHQQARNPPSINVSSASKPSGSMSGVNAMSGVMASPSASVSLAPSSFKLTPQTGTEVAGLHSLLDTILLAVENEKVINPKTGEVEDASEAKFRQLAEDTSNKMIKWKKETNTMRLRFTLLLREKNKQLQTMRMSQDVVKTGSVLTGLVGQLREDFMLIRRDVVSSISKLQSEMGAFVHEMGLAVHKFGNEMAGNREMRQQQRVMHDALKASVDCFLPMMKMEYASGSHPWHHELQHAEPITAYLMTQHKQEHVTVVAKELEYLQKIYRHLKYFNYVIHQQPQENKPMPGRMLDIVAARLMIHPDCSPELWELARGVTIDDQIARQKVVRINATLQTQAITRIKLEGIKRVFESSPGVTPQQVRDSVLARKLRTNEEQVMAMKQRKRVVTDFRLAGAKKLWLLWIESKIDIFRGKGPRATKELHAAQELITIIPTCATPPLPQRAFGGQSPTTSGLPSPTTADKPAPKAP